MSELDYAEEQNYQKDIDNNDNDKKELCVWKKIEDVTVNVYTTTCRYIIFSSDISEYKYCPYCGKKVSVK